MWFGRCTQRSLPGNSYTYVNDLPSPLPAGGFGRPARPGFDGRQWRRDPRQHAAATDSQSAIVLSALDYVVLQEQSDTPATWAGRVSMYPAVRTLDGRSSPAAPRRCSSWPGPSRRNAGVRLADYRPCKLQIDNAYLAIAREQQVRGAGRYTWLAIRRITRDSLWGDDGSHPNGAATYLAACVFYARYSGRVQAA